MILTALPSQRPLWSRALMVAAGVHALAIGTLFLRVSTWVEPSVEMPAIAIEMADPSTIPAPIHDVATPEQVEAPKQVEQKQPVEKKPPFDPPPTLQVADVKPEVTVPLKKDTPQPVEKVNPLPPAPTTTALAAPDLKPDAKVAARITGGASAGKASEADLWDARVRSRIELTKRYPSLAARQNQQDEVDVLLTIDRSGRLLNARIRGSHGFPLLDEAALDAVRRAAPFPKPPKEVEGDPILYSVIIRFVPRKR